MFAAFEIPMNEGIIVGIVIILIMIIPIFLTNGKRRERTANCTEEVSAQVIRVDKHTRYRGRRRHGYTRTYAPVYTYQYGGRAYTCATWGIALKSRKAGELVTVKVNPNDPEEFYDPKHERLDASIQYSLVAACMLVGVFFLVMGVMDAQTEADPRVAAAWLMNWKG